MEPDVDPSTVEPGEVEFDHEELRVFWDLARFHAKLNAAPTYFGPTTLESVPPPAWDARPAQPHSGRSALYLEMTLVDNRDGRVLWHVAQRFPASGASDEAVTRAARAMLATLP